MLAQPWGSSHLRVGIGFQRAGVRLRHELKIYSMITVQVALDDDVRLTSSRDRREHNMLVVQEALARTLYSVEKLSNLGFEVHKRRLVAWNCFPTLLSYCADIVDAETNTTVRHCMSITRTFHLRLNTTEEFKPISTEYLRKRFQTENVGLLLSNYRK